MTDRVVDDTLHMAEVLRTLAAQVTAEEFGWQEANYSRDSELGRELVYLIANNEWVRATSEFIDVTRSDMVETTVKIDVDLDCITHEAFRNRTGRLWLPVFVLPPLCEHGRRLPEPDPFGTMTVTSASGKLLPTLPGAEVRHRISAALAEIIVNMAATRLAKTADTLPTATRDHRLVLSAAIYRLLRQWPSAQPAQTAFESGQQPEATSGVSRLSSARQELDTLLNSYVNPASRAAMTSDGTGSPAASEAAGTASGPGQQQDGTQAVRLLAERAVKVLRAFAESAVVVVAVPSDPTPIVLTLSLPSRPLHPGPRDQVTRKWSRPRTWRWLHWRTWNWVLPRAQIQVDLLLPSADADRQIRVDLPEGVSCDPSRPATSPAEMEIKVSQPPPFQHLRRLMDQLLEKPDRPAPLQKSVADLAAVMADAASESMRDHRVEPAPGVAGRPPIDDGSRTATFCKKLKWLRQMLDEVSEASGAEADIGRADALGADGERADAGADHALLTVRGKVAEAWDGGKWLGEPLLRCTSVDSLGPRTVLAKAGMIEDVSKRGAPTDAKIHIHVAVTDAEYFSIARFTSRMSSLLMAVVFGFFLVTQLLGWENSQVSPEVLAFVLTLFSAIQAGRIERADRTTMHGLLSGAGSFLIVASVLPSVILAVALAFSRSGLWPIGWAAGAIGLQIVVQQLLRIRGIWEHALTSDSASPVAGGLSLQTEPPNYDHGEVLHSGWWRGATANALMIGRPAYGYMIWQHDSPATLRDLLSSASPEPAAQPPTDTQAGALSRLLSKALQRTEASDPEGIQGSGSALSLDLPAGPGDLSEIVPEDASVLALQRSGTASQSVTFVVFREEPKGEWIRNSGASPVELDPEQLAPIEDGIASIEIFAGLRRDQCLLPVADHPVSVILGVAAHWRLLVLDGQLCVPTPAAGYSDLLWARVRITLHGHEIEHIARFLDEIYQHTIGRNSSRTEGQRMYEGLVVAVRLVPEGALRILNPRPGSRQADAELVLARDMDVMAAGPRSDEDLNEKAWRIIAICADARVGIENEIIKSLSKELQLAGLTCALLYGKAVFILVGHEPGGQAEACSLSDMLGDRRTGTKITGYLDEWQSRTGLGLAARDPVLRVQLRVPDRAGLTLAVLDSLREMLPALAPGELKPENWQVWYARSQVIDGNVGLIVLIARLTVDPVVAKRWSQEKFEDLGRQVRMRSLSKAADRHSQTSSGFRAPEETELSVRLIWTPS